MTFTDPVLDYSNGTGPKQGMGIVAGAIYSGTIASLANHYVFGDKAGSIWAIPGARLTAGTAVTPGDYERRNEDFVPDAGTIDHPVAIISGSGGSLFILDSDGELFRA